MVFISTAARAYPLSQPMLTKKTPSTYWSTWKTQKPSLTNHVYHVLLCVSLLTKKTHQYTATTSTITNTHETRNKKNTPPRRLEQSSTVPAMVAPRLSTVPTGFASQPPIDGNGHRRAGFFIGGHRCRCLRSSLATDELLLFGSARRRIIGPECGQPADDAPRK